MILRQILAVLVAVLLATPSWAGADTGAIGTVENSRSATIRGVTLAPGTTLFSGDKISVGPQGNAWVSLPGGANILVGQNSRVQILKNFPGGVAQIEVDQGRAKFSSSEKTPVEFRLADATIRPAKGPAIGLVAFFSPREAVVDAEKGDVVITTAHNGDSVTLHEGSAMALRMVPQDDTQNTETPARKRKGLIVLLGVAIIGAVTAAAIAANNAEPTQNNKGGAVSPFSFP